jgi:hypothetical protein
LRAKRRRIAEITRLRDKVKTLTAENKEVAKTARSAGLPHTLATPRLSQRRADKIIPPPIDIVALEENVRSQGTALSERLLSAKSGDEDAALREEMADLASKMIVLTTAREGASSPVHDLLAAIDPALEGDERSLAQRVREQIRRDET